MSKADLIQAYTVMRPKMVDSPCIVVNGHLFFAMGDPADGEFYNGGLLIVTMADGFRAETPHFKGPVAGSPLSAIKALRTELDSALRGTDFAMVRGRQS